MESECRLTVGATRYAAKRAFIPIIEVRRLIGGGGASLHLNPYAIVVIDESGVVLYPLLEKSSFDNLKNKVPGLMDSIGKRAIGSIKGDFNITRVSAPRWD